MAAVTLGLPTFSSHEDEDIDAFIHLVHGYFNAINLAPVGNSARCMELFQACFKGDAAVWFDDNILEKRWALHNLYNNHGQANMAGIQGRTMAQLIASNSLRVGTNAHAYATIASNNALTVREARTLTRAGAGGANIDVWIPLEAFDQDWSMLDGRPTDDNNPVAAVGNARPVTLNEI